MDGHDEILSLIRTCPDLSDMANKLMGMSTVGVERGAVITTSKPRYNMKKLRDQFFEAACSFKYFNVAATGYVFDTVLSEITEETREGAPARLAECCTCEDAFDCLYSVVLTPSLT